MYHSIKTDEVLKKLKVRKERGLGVDDVRRSREIFGRNTITSRKERSIFGRIIDALCEPMMLILLAAWAITFGVNLGRFIKNGSGNFYECIGIMIAIAISVALTVIMEGRSKKAFQMLNAIRDNVTVKVVRDGETKLVGQSEIVVGDIVILSAGDKIIADCRLISSNNLEVDESMLTGESAQVKKNADVVLKPNAPLAERENCVYSGTFVTAGDGLAVVTEVGDKAEIGKIAGDLTQSAVSAPLQEKLQKLGKLVSIMGAVSAVFVFALSLVRLILLGEVTFDAVENIFIEAIVLIVAAVPEGLPSTVAISLSLNVLKLAKSNALIKKLVATETIGSVSVICSDKTGTLTQNKMTVSALVTPAKVFREDFSDKFFALNAAINSTCDLIRGEISGSKTEGALLSALLQSGISYKKLRKSAKIVSQIPFSSDTKFMQTEADIDGERITLLKGAPEVILSRVKISDGQKNKIMSEISAYQSQSKRVIAFSHENGANCFFDGFAVLEDKLRDDVVSSVQSCKAAGIKVKMLTGDNIITAAAIANELGIGDGYGRIVCGDEIDKMSDETLKNEISKISVVARSTPKIKLRIVRSLQSIGEVVAVTGDGVNDAPAIRNADIGIAMGDGSEITKEASDVVLLDNSFSTIITAISFGRNIYRNFQRFITFQLTVNLSSMCIIIAFLLMGMESPFSSTCLLWLNVIMDGPLAISLSLEKADGKNLEQKPVKRSDGILSGRIIARIAVHGVVMSLVCVLQEMFNFLGCLSSEKHTVTFAIFVIFQLFNAINCREIHAKSALKGIFGNRLLLIVGVLTFILQIIITQFFPNFFGTVPLSPLLWCKITLLCSLIVFFSEAYKAVYRFYAKNFRRSEAAKNLIRVDT